MNFSNPILRTLVPTIGAAYAFQIACSVPAMILQEDRFYGTRLKSRLISRFLGVSDLLGMYCVVFISSFPSCEVISAKSRTTLA
jgi:hypothetical protein